MLDFLIYEPEKVVNKKTGDVTYKISPEFKVRASKDLMIRGGDFYSIWDEEKSVWSLEEDDALELIDIETKKQVEEFKVKFPNAKVSGIYSYKSRSGLIDQWHKYVQKQMRDHYHQLDEKLIFSNQKSKKTDYSSKSLEYPLEPGDISAYEKLVNVLYEPEERRKLEWAIGAIVSGESKEIQKFLVLYGSAGTGKSTVLNIIQMLFDGYYSVFDAKALGTANNQFAMESLQSNPLVAIQHDGDLSRIEDNTRLNSIVSHEKMLINVKFKSAYEARFNAFLFMGTNKPVKITDAKSGIIRRLIDVHPSGNKVPSAEYNRLMAQIKFELGAIAHHCLNLYLEDPNYYDSYIPVAMIGATNDIYNFMEEHYFDYCDAEQVVLNEIYKQYIQYCTEANVAYPYPKRVFKEEIKNYFKEFKDRGRDSNGNQVWNVYSGFIKSKFEIEKKTTKNSTQKTESWLKFNGDISLLDKECAECPAQLAKEDGTPLISWSNNKKKLKDIDTKKLHYVKPPEQMIVIDFDLKDENGNKSYSKNLEAASKWPPTYAELSKSGAGIHLHYIYEGDTSKLSRVYEEEIEIKVFTGNASLRRMVSKCNDIPVAKIASGLPLKKGDKMVNWEGVKSEKQLRALIKKNLNKEIHPATKPSIDFIYKILEDANNSGLVYDISDMRTAILTFAMKSSHQAEYCIGVVNKMKFVSDTQLDSGEFETEDKKIMFYDVEVFPNLFLINWKYEGSATCTRMINPTPAEVEKFLRMKIIGYNCRRYDNHICWARSMGYSNEQLFRLSQKIVNDKENKNCFFSQAYNLSYTDVYDYCSKKQSLKKWEIELGIHHHELGLPWDQPVPEELWEQVAEYCDDDVFATEAVYHATEADFKAREILVELANIFAPKSKSTVNDTTNTLTGRIIFGDDQNPQTQFVYTDLSKEFPGYKFENGKSYYKGEEIGEGGYVYAEPGMYSNTKTFDVASMHPHSVIRLNLFGDIYTKKFKMLVDLRIMIKHKEFDKARELFEGVLAPYLEDEGSAKSLANALKIAINSVYGLTSAKFDNKFKDKRNVDNIVAKRGELFMINLKYEVQSRGYKVAHIKTDSIKIVNPDEKIAQFICEYGKKYGYTFEVEDEFDRICLVNDAVYIAKETNGKWTATGAQFAHPVIFKTLFSKEPIEFKDLCETKSVSTSLYLDMNENLPEGEHDYKFVGKVGSFVPVKTGAGGGELVAKRGDGYAAATGTKGYRWLESEMVKQLGKENDICKEYYQDLIDKAADNISKFGDIEWFIDDSLPEFIKVPKGAPEEVVIN